MADLVHTRHVLGIKNQKPPLQEKNFSSHGMCIFDFIDPKKRFQQSALTHSGAEEKETLNMKLCERMTNNVFYISGKINFKT